MPDGETSVPICEDCWKQLSIPIRCHVVAQFKQADSVFELSRILSRGMMDSVIEYMKDIQLNHSRSNENN